MDRRLESLSVDECLQLLSSRSVGRIAFLQRGEPEVLPVNYRVRDGSVLFRTDYGALLDAVHRSVVAFEVDDIEAEHHRGWSVVVKGRAEEVVQPDELARLRDFPLQPWAPGQRDHYVRISPSRITGRRIR